MERSLSTPPRDRFHLDNAIRWPPRYWPMIGAGIIVARGRVVLRLCLCLTATMRRRKRQMGEAWFEGRVLTGVELTPGRRWTFWIPDETLAALFATFHVPVADLDRWAADGGMEVLARAAARTAQEDSNTCEAYIRVEDL